MAISAVNKIKDATKHSVGTVKAARGDSDYALEIRRQLGISAMLALGAGAIGFFALRAMRCEGEKATAHEDWASKDKQLDKDLADSLDASDAVAKY